MREPEPAADMWQCSRKPNLDLVRTCKEIVHGMSFDLSNGVDKLRLAVSEESVST
jgi:hypothetical protein